MFPALILIITIAVILLLVFSIQNREKSGWVTFFSQGKEAGFSLRETEIIRKLVSKMSLQDPSSIFTSQDVLDHCIKNFLRSLQLSGTLDNLENQDLLSKLYEYRKRIELEKTSVKRGISNSRQMVEGQDLRVLVQGSGVFKAQVVKNTTQYITITRPTSSKGAPSFSWTGLKLSIYFWRSEDAGYVFDTEVLDEVFSKGLSSLKIAHKDNLFRTQKRKSVRVKIHKSAYLYLLLDDDDANRLEMNPGQKCFLEDLSDTGCAITIGGKADPGLRIKVQFALNNSPIVMGGTVRSVEFSEERNRSLLRVEADPLPIEIRNKILGEVFGMLPEEEEDLPFRVLGEEAEQMSVKLPQGSSAEKDEMSYFQLNSGSMDDAK